ncbi:hypothetical protein TorRG33x02_258690 [Trema orientale]|uniref:Uncharacterized protein n=1 Tax=Trema orientale TaxID=63057 RepID=A0A2P5D8T7_TREOI|nr:hypothetical protein TorRG33x02_258690 [Trema orientale]
MLKSQAEPLSPDGNFPDIAINVFMLHFGLLALENHDGKASWELLQSLSAPSRTLSENHAIRLLKDQFRQTSPRAGRWFSQGDGAGDTGLLHVRVQLQRHDPACILWHKN